MITPGSAPEGAYVPGASFGPDNRGVPASTAIDQAKAQMSAPYMGAFGDIGQILTNTLNGILQAVVNGIVAGAQAVGMLVTGVINTITDAIQWVTDGIASLFGFGQTEFAPDSQLAEAKDRQLELNHRLDLMEDVSGYIATYMKENRYKNRRTWNLLEFNGQLGPEKNAELIPDGTFGNTIWLAKGTWVISAHVTHDQHADRMSSRLKVTAFDPTTLGEFSTKEAYSEVFPNKYNTLQLQHTIVVPEDTGMYVAVSAWYDVGSSFGQYPRLLYRGGTHLSHLTAHRLDLNADNAVREEDVPTIGSGQGNDG